MNQHEIAVTTALAVAAIRARVPRLDGWPVLLVALAVASALSFLQPFASARDAGLLAFLGAVEAVGGVSLAGYVAGKAAGKFGSALGSPIIEEIIEAEGKRESVTAPLLPVLALALVVLLSSGCALLRSTVVDELQRLAGEVCVESDEVSVCASKCAHEAERRRAEAEASTPIDGGASP